MGRRGRSILAEPRPAPPGGTLPEGPSGGPSPALIDCIGRGRPRPGRPPRWCMARIDRSKRALGTAIRRDKPSQAAKVLVGLGRITGRVLDYGCGHGFDADHFGWEA